MTFTPKAEYRRGIIHPDLLLLCIVSYAHSDVIVASATAFQRSLVSNIAPSRLGWDWTESLGKWLGRMRTHHQML